MVDIPVKGGRIAQVSTIGISLNGDMIVWADLIAAMYAASQVCREGSRKHDDLFQASYDYLPSIQRQTLSTDPEDALTFCGMERPQ